MKHVYFTCLMCLIISTTTTAQQTSELFQTELRFLDGSVPQSESSYGLSEMFITDATRASRLLTSGLLVFRGDLSPFLQTTYGYEELEFSSIGDGFFDDWFIGTNTEGTTRRSFSIREESGLFDDPLEGVALHIEPMTETDGHKIGIGTQDPSETLDVDGAIKVRETTVDPEPNVIYGNSTPLAYGRVNGNQLSGQTFGVTSVTKTATGRYTIVIDNGGSIFFNATMFDTQTVGFISFFQTSFNTITVRTTDQFGADTDRGFDFVVFGTPAVDD